MTNKLCDRGMTFQDCELAILRTAVDQAEEKQGKTIVNSPDVKKMISIVENFIRRKKLICYGGTAINAILPKQDQFYNKDTEIADYDFFSTNALADAKELADIYFKEGFEEVEAKSGQHHGTYKVFVNFIGMADITQLHKDIFKTLKETAISVAGILYCSPNYLRMSMYLELSRPSGDVSRWEKVLKRLTLLNKHHPLKGDKCNTGDFQREMETITDDTDKRKIYDTLRDTFIDQGVVFFGGYAMSMYRHYMPKYLREKIVQTPDFDVLSEEPHKTATIVKERLKDNGIKDVKIVKHNSIGEIVAPHYQIIIGNSDTVAFVYQPIACHSYNIVNIHNEKLKIATIDTMLSFYLAFLYSGRSYYDDERIICMAEYLYKVQEKNKLQQKGVLKRFSLNCYGHQETIEEMRAEKTRKFEELKKDRRSAEFEEWFLRFRPAEQSKREEENKQFRIKEKEKKERGKKREKSHKGVKGVKGKTLKQKKKKKKKKLPKGNKKNKSTRKEKNRFAHLL